MLLSFQISQGEINHPSVAWNMFPSLLPRYWPFSLLRFALSQSASSSTRFLIRNNSSLVHACPFQMPVAQFAIHLAAHAELCREMEREYEVYCTCAGSGGSGGMRCVTWMSIVISETQPVFSISKGATSKLRLKPRSSEPKRRTLPAVCNHSYREHNGSNCEKCDMLLEGG